MNKLLLVILVASFSALAFVPEAQAGGGGIADMGDRLRDQIGSLTDLIGAAAFIVGLVFGASGLMKFKQHSENPQGTPISHAMVRLLVAGALIALPSVLGTSVGTLFAGSTNMTDNQGLGLETISRR